MSSSKEQIEKKFQLSKSRKSETVTPMKSLPPVKRSCVNNINKSVVYQNKSFDAKESYMVNKSYDNINDIERYKGKDLLVTRENAVPLEEGEYFIADLIDLDVVDEDGNKLGILYDVMQTGANDVYVVKNQENGKEILLPGIEECILDINLEEKKITVHLMEGLVDE